MNETFLTLGGTAISGGEVLAALGAVVVAALLLLAVMVGRSSRERREEAAGSAMRAEEIEERMAELARIQAETAGRLATMGEVL